MAQGPTQRKEETCNFTGGWGKVGGPVGKKLPAEARDAQDSSLILGGEDPPDDGLATHSRILAQRTPRTEEPAGLQSEGSQRVRRD